MANSKPKKTATKSKVDSSKAKTKTKKTTSSAKTTKAVKAPAVAIEKKVGKEVKSKKVEEKVAEVPFKKEEKEPGFFKTFFAKKCDNNENILTIFKTKKIWGAVFGELFGTMLLSIVCLTLGVFQPLYMFFIMIGLTLFTFGLSGANLNPLITAGMLATRRMSAIRGVLYFIAQILGAWLGFLIVKAFCEASGQDAAEMLTKMEPIETETFWLVTMIEFFGSAIFGLAFARALQFKRSALTFAMGVAGGIVLCQIVVIIISSNFAGFSDNFALNPAVALMFQILPTSGSEFGEVFGKVMDALTAHVFFPVLGGIAGFYISDLVSTFKGEKMEM